MKESWSNQGENSLSEKPAAVENALKWVTYVGKLDEKYSFSPQLELTSPDDKILFALYFAQRLVRYKIYDQNRFLQPPETAAFRSIRFMKRIMGKLDDELDSYRDVNAGITLLIDQHKEEKYAEDSQLPRIIELSANDLVYANTKTTQQAAKIDSRFLPQKDSIENWAARWSSQIKNEREKEVFNLGNIRAENV